MDCGIYIFTNKINKKKYIGQKGWKVIFKNQEEN